MKQLINNIFLVEEKRTIEMEHYCFDTTSNIKTTYYERIHIPIADKCYLGCIYCNFISNKNEGNGLSMPGTCEKTVIGQTQMVEYLENRITENTKIIGISGPGDPFLSEKQLQTFFEIYERKYLNLDLCICSSGINFCNIKKIVSLDAVKYITLTINSLSVDNVKKIYRGIQNNNFVAENLIEQQMQAISFFKGNKRKIKVNTVFLPEINENDIISTYLILHESGVNIFNLMPCQTTHEYKKKYDDLVMTLKNKYNIPILNRCLQCKSDSCYKERSYDLF